MVPPDKLFCDKKNAKITLGILIIWKFMSEGFEFKVIILYRTYPDYFRL